MKTFSCCTVGHSNRSIEAFVHLLHGFAITCVADVRSMPYSRRYPQFNRESLKTDLQLEDIEYLYLGDRLGARHTNPSVLMADGRVDFSRVRELPSFTEGIDRVIGEIENGLPVALMCAEKDPFSCHRFVLVSRELSARGVEVRHLLSPGIVVTQQELERQLLEKYGLHRFQPGLFDKPKTRNDLLTQAYALRNRDIAYKSVQDNVSENTDAAAGDFVE